MLAGLLQALFPRCCVGCGQPLSGAVSPTSWEYLCPPCARQLRRVGEEACTICARAMYGTVVGARICADCRTTPPPWGQARCLVRYLGPARGWVRDFKFKNARYLERDLHRLLRSPDFAWLPDYLSGAILVPVPLHPWRAYTRGFNQSLQLAHLLAPLVSPAPPIVPLLRRIRYTRQQARLHRSARVNNVKNAFDIHPAIPLSSLHGQRLVLVDDLLTTGSTLASCARTLRRAGFSSIDTFALARG